MVDVIQSSMMMRQHQGPPNISIIISIIMYTLCTGLTLGDVYLDLKNPINLFLASCSFFNYKYRK